MHSEISFSRQCWAAGMSQTMHSAATPISWRETGREKPVLVSVAANAVKGHHLGRRGRCSLHGPA